MSALAVSALPLVSAMRCLHCCHRGVPSAGPTGTGMSSGRGIDRHHMGIIRDHSQLYRRRAAFSGSAGLRGRAHLRWQLRAAQQPAAAPDALLEEEAVATRVLDRAGWAARAAGKREIIQRPSQPAD